MSIPTKDTRLVYDGDCAFCTLWVNRLQEILPVFPDAIPWQWADLDALALSNDDVARFAWVVTPAHHYAGHLAFSALLRMQPRWWMRLAGWVLATPPYSWVAASGYALIAKNRHRLPGGTPACQLPPAQ